MKQLDGYPLKRVFDLMISVVVLTLSSPLLLGSMLAVFLQDLKSPLYLAKRVGLRDGDFTMIKIRSMVANADKTGVNSTGNSDMRITAVGRFIRRFKIDELSQFLNVLLGDMSVVGPRPNTRKWGVDLYSLEEKNLLLLKPGITDLSSIVFSDEGEILANSDNPDLKYNQVIRPWKSRLGLFYLQNVSIGMDMRIVWLTAVAIIDKKRALSGVVVLLKKHNADPQLIEVARRVDVLPAAPPPGMKELETGALYARMPSTKVADALS